MPRGSYSADTWPQRPLFVIGRSLNSDLVLKSSECIFHCSPSDVDGVSEGELSGAWKVMVFGRDSSGGYCEVISGAFDCTLQRFRSYLCKRAIPSWMSWRAASSVGAEPRKSST